MLQLYSPRDYIFMTGEICALIGYTTHVFARVATKVGFPNFAKYEISRNKLLISRNFGKFREIYSYEFREIYRCL